ncbi:MAG TPA: hypothetical protein PLD20_16105 [Blastocatellia bacterium]|nr:hypothetical protein [Blastocatellia bacterium]HMV83999.1 hypothetical protein [Blastocatellia bacterium]HMX24871.1 hypothetical protein [Blastocatellia bacterium]HMY76608.1 hypothetical protein [Blastocatellia bacterium]HMZ19462.1 hypothetical protein [Blastocatellia bacterium]
MAYSDFRLSTVTQEFSLKVSDKVDLFASVPEITPSERLSDFLQEYGPYGLRSRTEKARSEFVVAPLLAEACKLLEDHVTLFSGVDFNIAPERGLKGTADFIFSLSTNAYELIAPAVVIIEAKKDDLPSAYGQCIAEMIAAQIFNERAGIVIPVLYGVVTTAHDWQFLKLDGRSIFIDKSVYYIAQPGKILAILLHILQSEQALPAQAA